MARNLANEWNPAPKPQHGRSKKTAKERGRITKVVYDEAAARSQGRCEWCGWAAGSFDPTGRRWGLEAAHLIRRRNCIETTAQDIAMLCGPSVNSGTCHNKVDYTKSGREWAASYRKQLKVGEPSSPRRG
ncbi:hypothetical protein [Paenibacillus ehimensis]|uniref:hypothetical protein n=1 Tax=Paenibacillus ehimensis TaxID=79264 RepID=UPI000472880E|nr:hypothetical protein [Paenibacillus ehimensis]